MNLALGFLAIPRLVKLITAFSVFVYPGGMLIIRRLISPANTRSRVASISSWCLLAIHLLPSRALKKYRSKALPSRLTNSRRIRLNLLCSSGGSCSIGVLAMSLKLPIEPFLEQVKFLGSQRRYRRSGAVHSKLNRFTLGVLVLCQGGSGGLRYAERHRRLFVVAFDNC